MKEKSTLYKITYWTLASLGTISLLISVLIIRKITLAYPNSNPILGLYFSLAINTSIALLFGWFALMAENKALRIKHLLSILLPLTGLVMTFILLNQ